MKAILAMVMVAVAGMSVSCRVNAPLNPITMKPSCKCCPENYHVGYVTTCRECDTVVIVGSK